MLPEGHEEYELMNHAMEKKRTVILTGANGYLGSYIVPELIRQGYRVIGLKYDHFASVIIDHPSVSYARCDIRNEILPQVEAVLKGREVTAVINAAALLGSSDYDKNFAVNAKGVGNLLAFARHAGIRRFIQVSSVVVIKEFKGPYGETKLAGQKMVTASELDYTVFIPAMILGPESMGLNRILNNVFRFPFFIPLIGNGRQTQHPVFVKDLASVIVRSLEEPGTFRKVYEIAGDRVIPFREFISLILEIRGRKKLFVPLPAALAKAMGRFFQKTQKVPLFTAEHVKGILQDSSLDTRPLKEDLGYTPTDIREALAYSLEKIGDNWGRYLSARKEETIKMIN
jgi:NADH dehydrogenase